MHPMYALKIRKSDLGLLAVLNGGMLPEVPKSGTSYLIVNTDPDGFNDIVSERELMKKFEVAANSPLVLRLKQPRY